jgi:hypothetical protein
MLEPSLCKNRLDSSFRDPGGFVFSCEGIIYRQINQASQQDYEGIMASGLYRQLAEKHLLISHEEVDPGSLPDSRGCYKIIKPRQLSYISYPYEWSFSQLKDAAILTLKIQLIALKNGFVLKDASAYNIQFIDGKPIFIDTLSFEVYQEGAPWVAYKQFCQHFLAPLALMAHTDVDLSKLLVAYIDGIPLPLASKLLPFKTRFNYSLLAHIHMHAKLQRDYADMANEVKSPAREAHLSLLGLQAMIQSLAKAIKKQHWKSPKTEWGDYYENTNYSDEAANNKRALVDQFLREIPEELHLIQDIGANTGEFSRVAAKHCVQVISQDVDPVAVESNYRQLKKQAPHNILPLIQNLFTPSPAIGWGNAERDSFVQRAQCDALLALALIHHIAISNNVPLEDIAKLFSRLTPWLIIEFVPKSDSQVKRLLVTRKDIFPNYTEAGFEQSIDRYFSIEKKQNVGGSDRTLYLLRRHN